jgi:D-glycero-D-manno-heptose 1,7-bisphosphate phosphatase
MALIDKLGLWCEIFAGDCAGRAALFLDRDGVIIEDTGYVHRVQELRLFPGAARAIGRCNRLGIPIVLVTNQSGIGRGYYGWSEFAALQTALAAALAAEGAHLDAVLACAYHGEGKDRYRIADHAWRKPNPGMILAAGERMGLNLPRSWIVGDRAGDLAAGRAAGLEGGVLVGGTCDEGERAEALALADTRFRVCEAATLADALELAEMRETLAALAPPQQ